MDKKPAKTHCTLSLSDYKSYSFDAEGCVIYFKGTIATGNKKKEDWFKSLAKLIGGNEKPTRTTLTSYLAVTSGFFSLIVQTSNEFYVISDIIRSIPVFYGKKNGHLFLANNLDIYQKKRGELTVDYTKTEEFMASGFVYGPNTLYKNVWGTQAGECVIISKSDIQSFRYFEFVPFENVYRHKNITDFTKALDKILLSVFSKMISETPNVNRWIVPLSGGHDSRLTINYLYRLGVKNVLCYTYGTSNNEQSRISKQVANSLGYRWCFVEYNEKKWLNLHHKGSISDFLSYSFNGVSTPHLQDFLAVSELVENKIIQKGDVFVKSHGDFIAGNHLSSEDLNLTTAKDAEKRVLSRHSVAKKNARNIESSLGDVFSFAKVKPWHYQEYFNWQERQAKYIVNSIQVYGFWGFECKLPFWEKEHVDFWLGVPAEERCRRTIFMKAEKHGLLSKKLLDVPYAGENNKQPKNTLLKNIKSVVPPFAVTLALRFTKRKKKQNEGLNQIFTLKAKTVRNLLSPVDDFPRSTRKYFTKFLSRYPHQMNQFLLTRLFTLRKEVFDKHKNH